MRTADVTAPPAPIGGIRCAPGEVLISRLGGTVQALRDAAVEKGWRLDWSAVDQLQQQAEEARQRHRPVEAVRLQAKRSSRRCSSCGTSTIARRATRRSTYKAPLDQ